MKPTTRVFDARRSHMHLQQSLRRVMAGGAIAVTLGFASSAAASDNKDARDELLRALDGMDETAGRIAPIADVRPSSPGSAVANVADVSSAVADKAGAGGGAEVAPDDTVRPRSRGVDAHHGDADPTTAAGGGGALPGALLADAGAAVADDAPVRGVTARASGKLPKAETTEKTSGTPMASLAERDVEKSANGGWLPVGLALSALAGVAIWLKRRATVGAGRRGLEIETLGTTRVLGKHAVSLVKIGGRVLVVGHGDKGLTLLTELDEGDVPSLGGDKQTTDDLLPIGGERANTAFGAAVAAGAGTKAAATHARTTSPRAGGVDTGAGSFIERVSRMRAGWKAEGGRPARHLDDDPFHAALMEEAPIDELQRLDDRAQIRERLEQLRRRAPVAVA
ncbi:MAG: flagellar biosynthetic protein FliO [Myxococcales bacterium]|nr:flagellar biosynthetic protein FliO [Myxococcales bacterium]